MSIPIDTNRLSEGQKKALALLQDLGQNHVFEKWDAAGNAEEKKRSFLDSVLQVEASYPGGLRVYLENAKRLLEESRQGKNPYEGLTPENPETVSLTDLGEAYFAFEEKGLAMAGGLVVVLVAGGLGERLGYSGIKVDIPVEMTTGQTYLSLYATTIRALQARAKTEIPFVIMTSRDTHERTLASLEKNAYFGLKKSQVHLIRQELVPALSDDFPRLAMDSAYELALKPHGHGDVHMLLHMSGLAKKFAAAGKTHLVFIQDTNAQVVNVILPALGVTVEKKFHFNSIAVSRIPGEAVGAITRLRSRHQDITINVEYNQLDALLRSTVNPQGDVADASGFSPFPGNINVLLIDLEVYARLLEKTHGIIAEFVNPKYADSEKKKFKKPTRLETMMQDLPKLFSPDQRVGVTVFDRRWSFSADKNNLAEARAKVEQKGPPESAATAESDFYAAGRKKAAHAGLRLEIGAPLSYQGIPFENGARVVFSPEFALTLRDVKGKIRGGELSSESTLVILGRDVILDNVKLKGKAGLWIEVSEGVQLAVKDVVVSEDGFEMEALSHEEMASAEVSENLKIRGYRICEHKPLRIVIREKGNYLFDKGGILKKIAG